MNCTLQMGQLRHREVKSLGPGDSVGKFHGGDKTQSGESQGSGGHEGGSNLVKESFIHSFIHSVIDQPVLTEHLAGIKQYASCGDTSPRKIP